jgi:hypothetical protein
MLNPPARVFTDSGLPFLGDAMRVALMPVLGVLFMIGIRPDLSPENAIRKYSAEAVHRSSSLRYAGFLIGNENTKAWVKSFDEWTAACHAEDKAFQQVWSRPTWDNLLRYRSAVDDTKDRMMDTEQQKEYQAEEFNRWTREAK